MKILMITYTNEDESKYARITYLPNNIMIETWYADNRYAVIMSIFKDELTAKATAETFLDK